MSRKYLALAGVVSVSFALVLGLAGCRSPVAPLSGSLTVSIGNDINARTLVPSISMDPASYTVSGVGPDGATFSVSTTAGTVTVDTLPFGPWTVTVSAFNASSVLIGQGAKDVTIHTAQTAPVTISVTPLTGAGTLSLQVQWPSIEVETPSIDASLLSTKGTSRTLVFGAGGPPAAFSASDVDTGYYTLVLQLKDNGVPVAGAVEVVRIVAGGVTSGTYAFAHVNAPGGTLTVNITPALGNPIPISIAGASTSLAEGTSMTVSASVGDGTPDVVWVWYLNGASIGSGASMTLGSALASGHYRLDVTGFTVDGTRAGSASASFDVVPASSGDIKASVAHVFGSGDGVQQRYPGLVVDPAGVVSIAFEDYAVWPDRTPLISSADGFTSVVDLGENTSGFGEGPTLALDSSTGLLHALIPRMAIGYDFFYANAGSWSAQTRITSLDGVAGRHEMYGDIAAAQGVAHAVWRMYNQEDGQVRGSRIQYATSQDWSDWQYVRAPIFGTVTNWGPWVSEPLMALDDSGVVHAVWSDGALSNHVLYARSTDSTVAPDPDPLAPVGSTRRVWTAHQLPITCEPETAWVNFDIAVGAGVVYVVQGNGDLSVYASSDGGSTWTVASTMHVDGLSFWTARAVYRDGALRIGAQAWDGTTSVLVYASSSDWVPRKLDLPSDVSPLINEGHTRTFDYRSGNAYFVWNNWSAGYGDTDIVLAVAPTALKVAQQAEKATK